MLHTKTMMSRVRIYKMCNVRTNVQVSYNHIMSRDRTYITYKTYNIRKMLHTNIRLFSVWTYVTYENVLCPNTCYTWIWDVFCPTWCYIRKYNVYKFVFYMKISCLMSGHLLYTKMCNVHISVLLFKNLDLSLASNDDKLHLAIPLSIYCQ